MFQWFPETPNCVSQMGWNEGRPYRSRDSKNESFVVKFCQSYSIVLSNIFWNLFLRKILKTKNNFRDFFISFLFLIQNWLKSAPKMSNLSSNSSSHIILCFAIYLDFFFKYWKQTKQAMAKWYPVIDIWKKYFQNA